MFVAGDEYVHPEGSVVVLTILADHTEDQSEKRARRVNYPVDEDNRNLRRSVVLYAICHSATLERQ